MLEGMRNFSDPSEMETWTSLELIVLSLLVVFPKFWVLKLLSLVFCCWSNIIFSCLPCSSILNCNFLWIWKKWSQLKENLKSEHCQGVLIFTSLMVNFISQTFDINYIDIVYYHVHLLLTTCETKLILFTM